MQWECFMWLVKIRPHWRLTEAFLDVNQNAFGLLRTHCHNKTEIQVEQDIIAAGTLKPPDCISDDYYAISNVTDLLAGRGKA